MKKLYAVLLAGLVGLMTWTAPALAGAPSTKQKVVYHVNENDPKLHAAALRNIQNHINAVGAENLDLRVVMHGDGLGLVLLPDAVGKGPKFKSGSADMQMQATIDGLKNQGVAFKICANTLKGKAVNPDEHLYNVDKADIVTSGVAELAVLQGQGYSYIKP